MYPSISSDEANYTMLTAAVRDIINDVENALQTQRDKGIYENMVYLSIEEWNQIRYWVDKAHERLIDQKLNAKRSEDEYKARIEALENKVNQMERREWKLP